MQNIALCAASLMPNAPLAKSIFPVSKRRKTLGCRFDATSAHLGLILLQNIQI